MRSNLDTSSTTTGAAHGRARPHRIAVPLDPHAAAHRAARHRAMPMVLIGPGLPLRRGGWVQQHQASTPAAANDQAEPAALLLTEPPMSGWMLATVIVGAISGLCLFVFGACALAQVI